VSLCTARNASLDPVERVRFIREQLPKGLFAAAWRLSPEPFPISSETFAAIESLGDDLAAFLRVLGGLYLRSAKGSAPAFVAEYLDAGKPEQVVKLARQNRFKGDILGVIRPDLILTEQGFIASEIDSVPGGMGFVGAMSHAYCEAGYTVTGQPDGMAEGLAAMLRSLTTSEHPVVAVVVSAESEDYRGELRWMAERVTQLGLCQAQVCSPQDIVFSEEALFLRLNDGREEKIDVLYRNFELFDLQNVPKSELMLYAARHNRVKMTPPPRATMEEKLSFALLHHPRLAAIWRKELGEPTFSRLLSLCPETWVLDPRPLPPQAAITGLEVGGEPLNDWMQLLDLGKSERDYVVKPSGFSELAWGSRGVRIANDLTKEAWEATLRDALNAYPRTPHILQRFHKGRRVRVPYLNTENDSIEQLDGRVRLCPYYFVKSQGGTQLGGILATIAPADKRLIHGMSDAIMAPCVISKNGY
jgi:hypothetical protein